MIHLRGLRQLVDDKVATRLTSSLQQTCCHLMQWTDSIMDKILKKVEIEKFITTALKNILKLVKLQSLVAKRWKIWKM